MKAKQWMVIGFLLMSMAVKGENRVKMCDGWRFLLGDDSLAMNVGYDDSRWERVLLPHDWSILQLPSEKAQPGNDGGWYEGGIGWYRTTITPKMLQKMACKNASRYSLYFEGVYQKATVYVNGKEAGSHHYGYTSFNIDITPYLLPRQANIVAVRVDNSAHRNCRWYSGSGIYRYVWLKTSPELHLDSWTTSFSTNANRVLTVATTVYNDGAEDRQAQLRLQLGNHVAKEDISLKSGEQKEVTLTLNIPEAVLWSPTHPQLYDAALSLVVGGQQADGVERRVGFRSIAWDAQNGLRFNGEKILANGACVHHDNGLLGAVATRDTEWRKVMLMKQAGFNLLRTSHNPPSESFLDACDELGMLVIDEAFDGWRTSKKDHDYHEAFDRDSHSDIQSMVRRDRHHASVVCWSIGNEVIERKDIRVITTARQLKNAIRQLDPERRPVTEALCAWDRDWEIYDPHAEVLDIAGYNYMLFKHASDHERDPERVIWQTESYPKDAFNNWKTVRDYPYVVGDIVWTGLDYLGESGIGGWRYQSWPQGESWQNDQWPWHGAYCGDVDITGHRKPVSYYRDMLWNDNQQIYLAAYEPDGYIEPIKTTMWSTWPTWRCWNWKGWEQKPVDVVVYSRQPRVRLLLNGTVIGEQPTTEQEQFKTVFRLPYQPGTLIAEGLSAEGAVLSRDTLCTAGEPYALRCSLEPSASAGREHQFISIEVVDADGNVCPQSSDVITATVKGVQTMAAFGNADLRCIESIHDNSHPAWHGRALLVLRGGNKRGTTTVTLSCGQLKPARLTVSQP